MNPRFSDYHRARLRYEEAAQDKHSKIKNKHIRTTTNKKFQKRDCESISLVRDDAFFYSNTFQQQLPASSYCSKRDITFLEAPCYNEKSTDDNLEQGHNNAVNDVYVMSNTAETSVEDEISGYEKRAYREIKKKVERRWDGSKFSPENVAPGQYKRVLKHYRHLDSYAQNDDEPNDIREYKAQSYNVSGENQIKKTNRGTKYEEVAEKQEYATNQSKGYEERKFFNNDAIYENYQHSDCHSQQDEANYFNYLTQSGEKRHNKQHSAMTDASVLDYSLQSRYQKESQVEIDCYSDCHLTATEKNSILLREWCTHEDLCLLPRVKRTSSRSNKSSLEVFARYLLKDYYSELSKGCSPRPFIPPQMTVPLGGFNTCSAAKPSLNSIVWDESELKETDQTETNLDWDLPPFPPQNSFSEAFVDAIRVLIEVVALRFLSMQQRTILSAAPVCVAKRVVPAVYAVNKRNKDLSKHCVTSAMLNDAKNSDVKERDIFNFVATCQEMCEKYEDSDYDSEDAAEYEEFCNNSGEKKSTEQIPFDFSHEAMPPVWTRAIRYGSSAIGSTISTSDTDILLLLSVPNQLCKRNRRPGCRHRRRRTLIGSETDHCDTLFPCTPLSYSNSTSSFFSSSKRNERVFSSEPEDYYCTMLRNAFFTEFREMLQMSLNDAWISAIDKNSVFCPVTVSSITAARVPVLRFTLHNDDPDSKSMHVDVTYAPYRSNTLAMLGSQMSLCTALNDCRNGNLNNPEISLLFSTDPKPLCNGKYGGLSLPGLRVFRKSLYVDRLLQNINHLSSNNTHHYVFPLSITCPSESSVFIKNTQCNIGSLFKDNCETTSQHNTYIEEQCDYLRGEHTFESNSKNNFSSQSSSYDHIKNNNISKALTITNIIDTPVTSTCSTIYLPLYSPYTDFMYSDGLGVCPLRDDLFWSLHGISTSWKNDEKLQSVKGSHGSDFFTFLRNGVYDISKAHGGKKCNKVICSAHHISYQQRFWQVCEDELRGEKKMFLKMAEVDKEFNWPVVVAHFMRIRYNNTVSLSDLEDSLDTDVTLKNSGLNNKNLNKKWLTVPKIKGWPYINRYDTNAVDLYTYNVGLQLLLSPTELQATVLMQSLCYMKSQKLCVDSVISQSGHNYKVSNKNIVIKNLPPYLESLHRVMSHYHESPQRNNINAIELGHFDFPGMVQQRLQLIDPTGGALLNYISKHHYAGYPTVDHSNKIKNGYGNFLDICYNALTSTAVDLPPVHRHHRPYNRHAILNDHIKSRHVLYGSSDIYENIHACAAITPVSSGGGSTPRLINTTTNNTNVGLSSSSNCRPSIGGARSALILHSLLPTVTQDKMFLLFDSCAAIKVPDVIDYYRDVYQPALRGFKALATRRHLYSNKYTYLLHGSSTSLLMARAALAAPFALCYDLLEHTIRLYAEQLQRGELFPVILTGFDDDSRQARRKRRLQYLSQYRTLLLQEYSTQLANVGITIGGITPKTQFITVEEVNGCIDGSECNDTTISATTELPHAILITGSLFSPQFPPEMSKELKAQQEPNLIQKIVSGTSILSLRHNTYAANISLRKIWGMPDSWYTPVKCSFTKHIMRAVLSVNKTTHDNTSGYTSSILTPSVATSVISPIMKETVIKTMPIITAGDVYPILSPAYPYTNSTHVTSMIGKIITALELGHAVAVINSVIQACNKNEFQEGNNEKELAIEQLLRRQPPFIFYCPQPRDDGYLLPSSTLDAPFDAFILIDVGVSCTGGNNTTSTTTAQTTNNKTIVVQIQHHERVFETWVGYVESRFRQLMYALESRVAATQALNLIAGDMGATITCDTASGDTISPSIQLASIRPYQDHIEACLDYFGASPSLSGTGEFVYRTSNCATMVVGCHFRVNTDLHKDDDLSIENLPGTRRQALYEHRSAVEAAVRPALLELLASVQQGCVIEGTESENTTNLFVRSTVMKGPYFRVLLPEDCRSDDYVTDGIQPVGTKRPRNDNDAIKGKTTRRRDKESAELPTSPFGIKEAPTQPERSMVQLISTVSPSSAHQRFTHASTPLISYATYRNMIPYPLTVPYVE